MSDAQTIIRVPLENITIWADKLEHGDCDTYGVGDWKIKIKIQINDGDLLIQGSIVVSEMANDETVILGSVKKIIHMKELEDNPYCTETLMQRTGSVSGPNIGARGSSWYRGKGIIKDAYIITDNFGCDVGKVGGTVRFKPLEIKLDCIIAAMFK